MLTLIDNAVLVLTLIDNAVFVLTLLDNAVLVLPNTERSGLSLLGIFEEHWRQSLRQWGEVWHVHEMCPVMGAHAALAFLPGHGPRRHLVSSRGQKFEQSLLTSPARRCGSPCPFFLSSSSPFSRRAFCSGPVLPRLEVPGRPSWGLR